jgi:hypothetical protein
LVRTACCKQKEAGIFILLLILVERHSIFTTKYDVGSRNSKKLSFIGIREFSFNMLKLKKKSQIGIKLCQIIFMHLLRWLFVVCCF